MTSASPSLVNGYDYDELHCRRRDLATARKSTAKKAPAAPVEPNLADSDAAVQALAVATEEARQAASIRRDAMQKLIDDGWTIVSTAETEEGDFYFEVERDGEAGTHKAFLSTKGKLTMEGK